MVGPGATVWNSDFSKLCRPLGYPARNTCQVPGTSVSFERLAKPTETQRQAFELIDLPTPLHLM